LSFDIFLLIPSIVIVEWITAVLCSKDKSWFARHDIERLMMWVFGRSDTVLDSTKDEEQVHYDGKEVTQGLGQDTTRC